MNQGESKNFDERLESPVFNAVVQNEILQSLSLAVGKAFNIKQYNPGKGFSEFTYRVLDSERIEVADNQKFDAWVIVIDGVAVPTTLWITKRTQETIKIKSVLKNGDIFWRVRLISSDVVQ